MRARPSPLLELVKLRLREFWRESGTLFWVFGFPLLMTLGLGLAFRSRPPELPRVAVVGGAGAPLAKAVLQSPRLRAESKTAREARQELARVKLDLVLDLQAGQPRYVYDATQERSALARLVVDEVLQRAAGRKDPIVVRETSASQVGTRYIDFLLPGLIGLNLMGSSMWGVGYNLVLARKRKMLRRLAVTPMKRTHFLLSYFFARGVLLLVELGVLVAFGALAFGTSVRGGYFALVGVALFGAASFAGISLLIGARVQSTEAANGWMNLVQLPGWVLCGAFFSYERFPAWLHGLIRCLPLTALIDALRAVYSEGASLLGVSAQLGVLLAWGALGFVLSLRSFRWQ